MLAFIGNSKASLVVEKYIYTILSAVFGWLPAIIVAMFPIIGSCVYYVFNINSLTVQNDGEMGSFQPILSVCWYFPLAITCISIAYCFKKLHANVTSSKLVLIGSD